MELKEALKILVKLDNLHYQVKDLEDQLYHELLLLQEENKVLRMSEADLTEKLYRMESGK